MPQISKSLSILLFTCVIVITAQVPRPSPELGINTLSGVPIRLTQYRGKVVLLEFLLTSCPHCQQTTEILKKLQKDYGAQGLQVIGSAVEEGAPVNLPGFVSRFQPGFPVGYNALKTVAEYTQQNANERMQMPELLFIDRSGIIRAQYIGSAPVFTEENIRREIESLLREALGQAQANSSHHR